MNVALHPQQLNIISLCTGGFGLDHAVELAIPAARTVCMVEREAFAVAQLVSAMEAGLVAPAPVWSDARTFNGRPWRGLVDGLIGGIPCQPHSLAGKRQGKQDERDLWSTARRIIVQSGVWFVLIENVRGMLSSGGGERVWRDLHRLGFEVEGGLFQASEVGATHERERLFILAVANTSGRHAERRRRAGNMASKSRSAQGEGNEWEWCGDATGNSGQAMADAAQPRGGRVPIREGEQGDPHSDANGAGEQLADSYGVRRRGKSYGSVETRSLPASRSTAMVNSVSGRRSGWQENEIRREKRGDAHEWASRTTLFPPGPDDDNGWRGALATAPELEPSFRRVANGLASRLDVGRVDRIRMLGNGVVPLEGAYALRTLGSRLAARGSAAAACLVRLMGDFR